MSKGLEAFKRIKSYFNPKQLLTKEKTLNDLDIIEKDLEEYQIAYMFIQELIDFFGITNLDDLKDTERSGYEIR